MGIDIGKLLDKFILFESDNKLFEAEINGVKIWHNIRMIIYTELLNCNGVGQSLEKVNLNTSISRRFLVKLLEIPDAVKNSPIFSSKDREVLIFSHDRRVKSEGFYGCIYTDILANNLLNKTIVVGKPNLDRRKRIIKNSNRVSSSYINMIIALKREFLIKTNKSDQILKDIDSLLSLLDEQFEVNLNTIFLRDRILSELMAYEVLFKFYTKLLKKLRPKIIIEVVNYDPHNMVVNSVAKELGIPTVELQHGTMGRYHAAYNFSSIVEINSFPDYIFTFGQFWKDNTRLPIEDDNIINVGWPYFDKKIEEYIKKNKRDTKDKLTLLFISQPTIGKELSEMAVTVSESLNLSDYKIIYKLHPKEYDRWKIEYPWLNEANIEIVDNNKNDMHYYFAQSNFQIGVASTALFEGLGYGLKTLIAKLDGHQYTEELYKNSLAVLVDSQEEILEVLKSEVTENGKSHVDYFWEPNSIKNMIDEINKIL